MIIRCSPLFEFATHTLISITIIGAVTAFFAASIGLVQNDLKKVIAFSTTSQLGCAVLIIRIKFELIFIVRFLLNFFSKLYQ